MTQSDSPDGMAVRDTAVLEARSLAGLVGGRLEGDGELRLTGIGPLDQAGPHELGLLADRRYLSHLETTAAGALLVSAELAEEAGGSEVGPDTRIVVDDPHAALPTLLKHFHPPSPPKPGVHPTAILETGVELGAEVSIGPYAVVGTDTRIGDRTRIGAHVVVGAGSTLGQDCLLHPHAVLYPDSTLGHRVIIHSGARIGSDGFGYATVDGSHEKIPQVGGCILGDDVEIGANSTIDRGSIGSTRIGAGTKLDNLVHIAHNVSVGRSCMFVAQVGIAGSTRIGNGVLIGGQSGTTGHLEIGDGARISAKTGVIKDLEAGATVVGFPARNRGDFLRSQAVVMKLPELLRRIRDLEQRLDEESD